MIPRWRSLAAAVVLLAACREAEAPPAADRPVIGADGENIVTLTRGAVVISRTGEATLNTSAVQAIDSDPSSFWATPPGDRDETMTIALPGETYLRRVGFASGRRGGGNLAKTLRFEASLDGASFQPLATVTLERRGDAWRDVTPAKARYLRVTTEAAFAPGAANVKIPIVHAAGTVRPSARPAIDGGWSINGMDAWFESSGDAVRGVTAENPPRLLEGGWDGPVLRLAWSRRNEHGVVAVTVDPEGRFLNGILWYLEAHRPFFGTTWFGQRAGIPEPSSGGAPPQMVFLRSDGHYPLYGLSFDGERLRPHSRAAIREVASLIGRSEPGRLRFVAHYVGTGTAESDRRLAAARLDRLREALRGAGVDISRVEFVAAGRAAALAANDRPWTPLQVVLNNRIDLELVRRAPQRR
ncbi:MAG TPA: discoidin domain-containing protein [Thermoanaerobaculia bacterium]|nr:discoidin domain-containing protein [Thermoanaerobaculia bacterium]